MLHAGVCHVLPDPTLLLAFAVASILLIVAPGPDTLYVAGRSMAQGRGAGLVAALGISTGLVVHSLAVAFGLASLVAYVPYAYDAVRYAGAAYILYLAWRALSDFTPDAGIAARLRLAPLARVYREAVITNVLNPKVAIFFVAFLPQFANPDKGNLTAQILTLATLFICAGFAYLACIALSLGALGEWLRGRPAFWRVQRWLMGGTLGAMAIWLAWPERR